MTGKLFTDPKSLLHSIQHHPGGGQLYRNMCASIEIRTGFSGSGLATVNLPGMVQRTGCRRAESLHGVGRDIKAPKISNTLLRHRHVAGRPKRVCIRARPCFSAYTDVGWNFLPDFMSYLPVKQGIATNFDLSYRVRAENTALVFSGQLNIKIRIILFTLSCDDGSKFYVEKTKGHKVIARDTKPSLLKV